MPIRKLMKPVVGFSYQYGWNTVAIRRGGWGDLLSGYQANSTPFIGHSVTMRANRGDFGAGSGVGWEFVSVTSSISPYRIYHAWSLIQWEPLAVFAAWLRQQSVHRCIGSSGRKTKNPHLARVSTWHTSTPAYTGHPYGQLFSCQRPTQSQHAQRRRRLPSQIAQNRRNPGAWNRLPTAWAGQGWNQVRQKRAYRADQDRHCRPPARSSMAWAVFLCQVLL